MASQQGRRPVYGQPYRASHGSGLHQTAPPAQGRSRSGSRSGSTQRPTTTQPPRSRSGRRPRPGDARGSRSSSPTREVRAKVDSGRGVPRTRAQSAPRREVGAQRPARSVPSHTVVRQRNGRTVYEAAPPRRGRRSHSAGRTLSHTSDGRSDAPPPRVKRGSFGSSDRFGPMAGYGPGRGEGARPQAMSPPPSGSYGAVHREVAARHSDRGQRTRTPTLDNGNGDTPPSSTLGEGLGGRRQPGLGSGGSRSIAPPGTLSRGLFSSSYGVGGIEGVPSLRSSPPSSRGPSPHSAGGDQEPMITPPSSSSPPAPPLNPRLQPPALPGQLGALGSMTMEQILSAPNGPAVLAQLLAALQTQGGAIRPAASPAAQPAPSKTLPLDEPPEDDVGSGSTRVPPQPTSTHRNAHAPAYRGPDLLSLAGSEDAPAQRDPPPTRQPLGDQRWTPSNAKQRPASVPRGNSSEHGGGLEEGAPPRGGGPVGRPCWDPRRRHLAGIL